MLTLTNILYAFLALVGLFGLFKLPGVVVSVVAALVMIGIFSYDAALQRMLIKAAQLPRGLQQMIVDHAGRHAVAKTRFITRHPDGAMLGYRAAQTLGIA